MSLLALMWGTPQTVLVVLFLIIVIVLIVVMSTTRQPDDDAAAEETPEAPAGPEPGPEEEMSDEKPEA